MNFGPDASRFFDKKVRKDKNQEDWCVYFHNVENQAQKKNQQNGQYKLIQDLYSKIAYNSRVTVRNYRRN